MTTKVSKKHTQKEQLIAYVSYEGIRRRQKDKIAVISYL